MNYSSEEEESNYSLDMDFIKKYEKILQINEYLGEYSESEEEPEGRLNVEIKEEELDGGGDEAGPSNYNDTTGFMSQNEEEQDEYYNPNADRYFGVSDDEGFAPPMQPFGPNGLTDLPDNMQLPDIPRAHPARRKGQRKSYNRAPPRGRYPRDYQPTNNPRDYNDRILNLDCVRHKEREIDGWGRAMQLVVQTNLDKFPNQESLDAYLEFHMAGNVRNWWNGKGKTYRQIIEKEAEGNVAKYIDLLERLLVNEFVGVRDLDNREATRAAGEAKAKYIIENIQMCNICYWRQYSCEFEKWFYKLNENDQDSYAERFYNKLPPIWAAEMNSKWQTKPAHITDGLAGRIRFLQETIEEKCKSTQFNQSIGPYNNKPCCDPEMIDIPTRWGCGKSGGSRRRKQTHYRKKKRYRKIFPKYRKFRRRRGINPPPNRYRKRRRFKKRNYEKDNCPRGKKTCKCWLCQEEGHYANECPKRKNKENKDKVKRLEIINRLEMEPIESDNESNYSEYEIEFEDKEVLAYEKPGQDWETCTEDDSDDESSEDTFEYPFGK